MEKKILRVARSLFGKRGVRDVNIDEICHALGISKKTFYQYYVSKEALVGQMVELHIAEVRKVFERTSAGMNPVELLLFASRYRPRGAYILSERIGMDIKKYYNDIFVEHTKKVRAMSKEKIMGFVKGGIDEGYFRDDMDVESEITVLILLHEAVEGYMRGEYIHGGKRIPARVMFKAFMDVYLHAILTEKGWDEVRKVMQSGKFDRDEEEMKQKNNETLNV